MKKSLLALAIAGLLPLSVMADVVVYGKANLDLQNSDDGDNSQLQLVSNASRIGVKGGEEVSTGLKVIYQYEYETYIDGDSTQTFGQRNIFIGLQGSAGTVMAGKFDTPVKVIQEKVDQFNDLIGDMKYVVPGEFRAGNIVQYVSPSAWGPLVATVAVVASEDSATHKDDGYTASVAYTGSNFYVALAAEQNVTAQDEDIVRLVGRYNLGDWQLGALIEQATLDSATKDANPWLVSARYALNDKWALKAQYAANTADDSDLVGPSFNKDYTTASVGFEYAMAKSTTLYGFYTQNKSDDEAQSLATASTELKYLGVGIDFKF